MNPFGPFFTASELSVENAPEHIRQAMYLLVKLGLERVRHEYGPVTVTSGYRSPEYNESLRQRGYNPSKTSQHLHGSAVDFVCKGKDMRQIFEWLRQWWPGQIIYYSKKGHIHMALPTLKLFHAGKLKPWIDNR